MHEIRVLFIHCFNKQAYFWNTIIFHTPTKLQQAFSQRIDICLSVGNTDRQFCALYFTRKLKH